MTASGHLLFVGRGKEAERIQEELDAGRNLVLTGPFGIGRTTLLKQLAKRTQEVRRFLFLSGAGPAGDMCEALFLALFPELRPALRQDKFPGKAQRRAIAGRALRDRRAQVIVLDDMVKITRQRLEFIRWLRGLGRFQVIAVVEHFVPEADIFKVRTALAPAPLLVLDYLDKPTTREFFETWSREHALAWGTPQVRGMVQASHGYPLNMQELALSATSTPSLDPPETRPHHPSRS